MTQDYQMAWIHAVERAEQAEQRLAEVTSHLTEAQKDRDLAKVSGYCDVCCGTGKPTAEVPCMCGGTGLAADAVIHLRERLFKVEEQAEAAEATIATLRGRIEDLGRTANVAVRIASRYPGSAIVRETVTELRDEIAALAAPAAGTLEVAVPGSQGERDTTRLTPLPGTAASLFSLIADALDDAGDSIGFLGQYTSGRRIQERARRLREAAGTEQTAPAEPPDVLLRIEVFREDDGRYAAEFKSVDGRIGGMGNYAGTPVGALAELCATLIKIDEDDSVERSEAADGRSSAPAPQDPTTKEK